MPHTFPTPELNPWGGSPDPRRAPSPGLSKFQRDPDGRPGGRLRTRASAPQKYVALGCHPAPQQRYGIGWKKSSRAAKILKFSNADDRSLSSALSPRRQANLRLPRLTRGDRGHVGGIRRLDFDVFGLLLYIAIEHADEKAVTQGRNHASSVAVRGRNQDRPRLQASQTLPASFRDESRNRAGKSIGRDSHKGPSVGHCSTRLNGIPQGCSSYPNFC